MQHDYKGVNYEIQLLFDTPVVGKYKVTYVRINT